MRVGKGHCGQLRLLCSLCWRCVAQRSSRSAQDGRRAASLLARRQCSCCSKSSSRVALVPGAGYFWRDVPLERRGDERSRPARHGQPCCVVSGQLSSRPRRHEPTIDSFQLADALFSSSSSDLALSLSLSLTAVEGRPLFIDAEMYSEFKFHFTSAYSLFFSCSETVVSDQRILPNAYPTRPSSIKPKRGQLQSLHGVSPVAENLEYLFQKTALFQNPAIKCLSQCTVCYG